MRAVLIVPEFIASIGTCGNERALHQVPSPPALSPLAHVSRVPAPDLAARRTHRRANPAAAGVTGRPFYFGQAEIISLTNGPALIQKEMDAASLECGVHCQLPMGPARR